MKVFVGMSVVALVSALTACGVTEEPANEIVANDMSAMTVDQNNPFAQSETTTDQAMPAAQTATAAAKSAAPKAAPAKPTPAKPKPAEPVPDPHAGHDMNNMQ